MGDIERPGFGDSGVSRDSELLERCRGRFLELWNSRIISRIVPSYQ